jgi:hypothetical protein
MARFAWKLIAQMLIDVITSNGQEVILSYTCPHKYAQWCLRPELGELEWVIRVTGELIIECQIDINALVDGQVNSMASVLGAQFRAD